MTKTCKTCGETKPIEQFYANTHVHDGHLNWCKPCTVKRYQAGVSRRQKLLLEYIQGVKMDRGCVDCGYRDHPAALDFDHLPGFVKTARLASMSGGSTRIKIDAEIAKCEVVCANCHRIRTANRRQPIIGTDRFREDHES